MRKKIAITAGIIALALVSAAYGRLSATSGNASADLSRPSVALAADSDQNMRTITVNQKHTSYVTPDKASVTIGIETRKKSADEAQKENSRAVDGVIQALKEKKIAEKSIQTSNYYITAEYDYSGSTAKLTGYLVSTSLTVNDIDADKAGAILSTAVKAGANRVDGISFFSSAYDDEYKNALKEAVKESKEKAEAIAEASGKTLAGVYSVTEGYQNDYARYSNDLNADLSSLAKTESASAYDSASIAPGQLEVAAEVTVIYEMK